MTICLVDTSVAAPLFLRATKRTYSRTRRSDQPMTQARAILRRMAFVVERNNDTSRYELMMEGVLQGVVIFRAVPASAPEKPVVLHISHAEVVPELRGKGFSEPMVRAALDDVRARGERVVSTCWYVSAFLESHPDYADLIAG